MVAATAAVVVAIPVVIPVAIPVVAGIPAAAGTAAGTAVAVADPRPTSAIDGVGRVGGAMTAPARGLRPAIPTTSGSLAVAQPPAHGRRP